MSTMGTASEANVKVQVDNQIRMIEMEDIPILGTSKVELSTVVTRTEEEYKFPGCLAELSVSFDYRDDIKRPSKENRAFQVDLLQQIVGDTFDSSDPVETSLIQKSPCGIRDPSLWTSNSSEYGIVGLYDPYGDGNHVSSLSIVVTVLVSLLIIAVLVFYCYCRQKKSEKYRLNTTKYPPTIGKEEKQLLKHGYMDTSGSSTEHSHVDLGDGLSPISIKKPSNGHTKPTPVLIKHETAIPKFEPLKIEQLPGSPRRVTRPVTKRMPPPPDYSPLHRPPNAPRILSSSKPVVLAAQRAPIASTHVDDL
uniref:Dystroglycan n=1 Tax=Panagrolaimus sp. JU765 TaxID=591449 RepID=A0AC34Q406_9BILA